MELIALNRSLAFLALMVMSAASFADKLPSFDICAGNESEFLSVLGGAALGSSFTASVAGQSVLLIVTEKSVLIAAAPAIAPILATTAVVASSAYVFMKGYCSSAVVTEVALDLTKAAVDGTVDTVTIVTGTYEIAVQQASEKIEVTADVHEIAVEQQSQNIEKAANAVKKGQGILTDWFCRLDPDCK